MRYLLLLLLVTCAYAQDAPQIEQELLDHTAIWLPSHDLEPNGVIKIKILLCPPTDDSPDCTERMADWTRAKIIVELFSLLSEDLENLDEKKQILNKGLRDHISVLCMKLADPQHRYD